jgi:hypothetical protein
VFFHLFFSSSVHPIFPLFYSYYLLLCVSFLSNPPLLRTYFGVSFFHSFSCLVRNCPGPISNYANPSSVSHKIFRLCPFPYVYIYFIIFILFIEFLCCLYIIDSSYKDLSSSLNVLHCHYSPQT